MNDIHSGWMAGVWWGASGGLGLARPRTMLQCYGVALKKGHKAARQQVDSLAAWQPGLTKVAA